MKMNERWREPNALDPSRLDLPRSPRVLHIRPRLYTDWTGEDGVEVLVVFDRVTKSQERDTRAWLGPIESRIRARLVELGERRLPFFVFKTAADLEIERRPMEEW